MQQQGYTMVWFGWQPDVAAGNNRMTMKVRWRAMPMAAPITGIVRNEMIGRRPGDDGQPAERLVHARQRAVSDRDCRQQDAARRRLSADADGARP